MDGAGTFWKYGTRWCYILKGAWSDGVVARPGAIHCDIPKAQSDFKMEFLYGSDFGFRFGPGSNGKIKDPNPAKDGIFDTPILHKIYALMWQNPYMYGH